MNGDATCMTRLFARLLAPTLAAAMLLVPAVAAAKPATPKITAPKVGTTVPSMPTLTWNPVKNAASYEVQIASDAGFNPALVDVTTLEPALPQQQDAVQRRLLLARARDRRGQRLVQVVGRAQVHEEVELGRGPADAREPRTIAYPSPAILTWTPVPGASTLSRVRSRRARPAAASTRRAASSRTARSRGATAASRSSTSNTNLAISTALHPGTYYWQVVPVDPEGHAGAPSAIMSFAWIWAGTTTPTVTDMVPGVEIYDPLFSWAADPGRRELPDRDQHDGGLRARLAG